MKDLETNTEVLASFNDMTPTYVRGPGQMISALAVPAEHQAQLRGYSRLIRTRYSDREIGVLAWRDLGIVTSIAVPDAPHPKGSVTATKLDTAVSFHATSAAGNSQEVWEQFDL